MRPGSARWSRRTSGIFLPMLGPFHGRFRGSRANPPRWWAISWTVQGQQGQCRCKGSWSFHYVGYCWLFLSQALDIQRGRFLIEPRTPGIVHRFQGSFYKYTRSFSRNEVPRPSYSTSMYSTVHLYGIRPRLISDPLLITNTPSPLMPLVQSVKYPYCEDIESIVANIVIFLSSRQS